MQREFGFSEEFSIRCDFKENIALEDKPMNKQTTFVESSNNRTMLYRDLSSAFQI